RAQALGGHALRISGQRPVLRGQLSEHDVQGDGGEVHTEQDARARARRPLHSSRRRRAELLGEGGAVWGLVTRGSVFGDGGGGGGVVRPAARGRERGGVTDAARDRIERTHPEGPPPGETRR